MSGALPDTATKEVDYDNAGRIIGNYRTLCEKYSVPFHLDENILSPDDSTLFCCSGMQKHKDKFTDINYQNTFANIQSCLRLNDIEEINDGNHLLYFNMIGLFSFREWSLEKTINFFLEFLDSLGIKPEYVTVHPDKRDWRKYYPNYTVMLDEECIWTDGNIGGYCTEFYYKGLEIGNIVNTLDTCIDVGFGLERLLMVLDENYKPNETEVLKETTLKLINSGIIPAHKKQGYVLRSLIRKLIKQGVSLDNEVFLKEIERTKNREELYRKLYNKHRDKSPEWWWETHGVEVNGN